MCVFILLFQRERISFTFLLSRSPAFTFSLVVVVWNLLSDEGCGSPFFQLLSK